MAPWAGEVGLTLRLSHFATFEVSYRIMFCFRGWVGGGCGLGPCSGLGFKTSCHWVKGCLGLLSTNTALLLEWVYWVRACLRGSTRNVSSWSASGFWGTWVILVLQLHVLPEHTMSVAWERVVKHEWKLLETHLMYQRFKIIFKNFHIIERVMVSKFTKL